MEEYETHRQNSIVFIFVDINFFNLSMAYSLARISTTTLTSGKNLQTKTLNAYPT